MDRMAESKDNDITEFQAKTLRQDPEDRGFTGYFCAASCYGLCAIYFHVSSFSLFIHLFYLNIKLFGAEALYMHNAQSLVSPGVARPFHNKY